MESRSLGEAEPTNLIFCNWNIWCFLDLLLFLPLVILLLLLFSHSVMSDSLDPMTCSTPGFLVLHYLPEFAQTHIHWVSDAIQSSHPLLLLPSIFSSIKDFSIKWPKYWSFSFSYQPFQWVFRVHFLSDWLVCSPCSPRDSQESSPAPQFKSINSLVLRLLCGPTVSSVHDYWKPSVSLYGTLLAK